MGKNKLKRFEENKTLPNVVEPSREEALGDFALKGRWHKDFFKNDHPIVLELGCGKGEYSVGMGKAFPDKNFIGVDIKGARFWFGAKEALANGYNNVAFLRSRIELIDCYFAENEVSEIWITFPDPQIQLRRAKHRLTHPFFLDKYKKFLKADHTMHLKTDSEFLHGYTLGVLQILGHDIQAAHHDIYNTPEFEKEAKYLREIKTYYEGVFSAKGKTITYIRFQLK